MSLYNRHGESRSRKRRSVLSQKSQRVPRDQSIRSNKESGSKNRSWYLLKEDKEWESSWTRYQIWLIKIHQSVSPERRQKLHTIDSSNDRYKESKSRTYQLVFPQRSPIISQEVDHQIPRLKHQKTWIGVNFASKEAKITSTARYNESRLKKCTSVLATVTGSGKIIQ